MSRCKKQKNACKICLQTVKAKKGIQCQGACEAWVHYDCLNYTAGKVKDIEAGVLHITCPCPDCKTSVPKEFRPDEPYSCNNICCPANNPPACDEPTCQANEVTRDRPPPVPPPGTLLECGYNCEDFKMNTWFKTASSDPCMEGFSIGIPPVSTAAGPSGSDGSGSDSDCKPPKKRKKAEEPPKKYSVEEVYNTGEDEMMPTISTVQEMCATVGQLTNQINELMMKMKQATEGGQGAAVHGARPGSPKATTPTGGQRCTMHGSKKKCPKPCFCPGNPCHK